MIPFVDRIVRVDLRERLIEVPGQTVITSDHAPTEIAFLVYYRIVDPLASVVNVADFDAAVQGIAMPTLRELITELPLDDVLAKRTHLDEAIRTSLDEQVEAWGGSVTQVEIREITPPPEVQAAMARQLAMEMAMRRLPELDKAHDAGLIADAEHEARGRRSSSCSEQHVPGMDVVDVGGLPVIAELAAEPTEHAKRE